MEDPEMMEVVRNTHAYGLSTYTRITAHPDEVCRSIPKNLEDKSVSTPTTPSIGNTIPLPS
ncbi:hypothetical protein N7532_010107 [Penicillium argentinense]|uniref:Uncharacterized protein n=1 Tax=Penicillium argentinense TaxID=1131581 RepID=A0A9W9JXT5_9EURO|nr:uncharacterized protein N7532_010107 [Penicillium argentinense]KAJ5085336.1 hypothetical protein N7532_010107 [Penicillium argentinense]